MTSEDQDEEAERTHVPLIKKLGPGLVTGAADDDPSGIATYSQAGAQYGYGLLWSVLFTTPLMIGIQVVSARIGRVTGHGLAANIREHFPRPLLYFIVSLLLVANTINIAADLGAMGDALVLVAGGRSEIYDVLFALVSLTLQIFIPFPRYAPILKWLTLALFAYVGAVLVVHVSLWDSLVGTLLPTLSTDGSYLAIFVAVLGTTISPYLFFWQASQEVEEQRATPGHEPLREAPAQARSHLARIKVDTTLGMIYSNLIAFCIMLTTAVTLHAAGITDIRSAAQAAEALRPLTGQFAFLLFALGIIGTGLLAVPILAGSAAYAVSETFRWPIGLGLTLTQARGFYAILTVATVLGVAIDLYGVDSMKMLVWAAIVNGVISVPIMAVMMLLAVNPAVMGPFVISRRLNVLGWLAVSVMAAAVVAMLVLTI
ncbi:MAG TPA: divalent metal cation transporter [Burkholderiales bacterium]|nr:divalent metal cation transporter [Burkholderiales bacterium]